LHSSSSSLSSSLDGLDVDEIDFEVETTLTSESLHDESDDFLIFFFIFFFSLLAVFSLSTSLICGMIFSFFFIK
jgi:hypothetical protein